MHQTTLDVCPSGPVDIDAGASLSLKIKVSCPAGCNLAGKAVRLVADDGTVREISLAGFEANANETPDFKMTVPLHVGRHDWRVVFPEQQDAPIAHTESAASLVLNVRPHQTTLAAWDLFSPLAVNCESTMKVGAKCSSACDMSGCEVEVHDHTGNPVTRTRLGPVPWTETAALYWAEATLTVPSEPGAYHWSVRFSAKELEASHQEAIFPFSFITVNAPEHRVTVTVFEKDTGTKVSEVHVRLGPHKAVTDERGSAQLEVPKDSYELNLWKAGYEHQSTTVHVTADTTLQLEIIPAPEEEKPYWMG